MSITRTAGEQVIDEVTSWLGVQATPGDRGELSIRLGRRELGHLHGDHALHIGFPKAVWNQLYEQGRIAFHPVFPGKPGYAARRIENEADVLDVIELLRINYDRAVTRHGLPAEHETADWSHTQMESQIEGLYASGPEPVPFAPEFHIRAFLLRRSRGNVLIYSVSGLESQSAPMEGLGGVTRQYLNHGHEAMFIAPGITAPLFVHEADVAPVAVKHRVRGTFSRRHMLDEDLEVIPTPGHTPGATAYLWDNGRHRFLFTGDTIYLDDGEWVAGVLSSSDRAAYLESLELIGGLDFDVLVPWAATGGQPPFDVTSRSEARRRVGAIAERVRNGEDH